MFLFRKRNKKRIFPRIRTEQHGPEKKINEPSECTAEGDKFFVLPGGWDRTDPPPEK